MEETKHFQIGVSFTNILFNTPQRQLVKVNNKTKIISLGASHFTNFGGIFVGDTVAFTINLFYSTGDKITSQPVLAPNLFGNFSRNIYRFTKAIELNNEKSLILEVNNLIPIFTLDELAFSFNCVNEYIGSM